MADQQLVLAVFKDEAAADAAVESMKAWDESDSAIKFSSIGVLVLDDKGKIKTHKLGKRSTGKGAGIGLVLAVIAPPTLLAGVIGGGILGSLHHKGLGLKAEDRARIAGELAGGKAAVGILLAQGKAEVILATLVDLGSSAEVIELAEADLEEVAAVAPAVETAEAAAPDEAAPVEA